jgi:hypothetical protein
MRPIGRTCTGGPDGRPRSPPCSKSTASDSRATLLPFALAALAVPAIACARGPGAVPGPSGQVPVSAPAVSTRTAPPPSRRVIVFVWDGLRPDSMTDQDTPRLSALAHQGAVFAGCSSWHTGAASRPSPSARAALHTFKTATSKDTSSTRSPSGLPRSSMTSEARGSVYRKRRRALIRQEP